MSAICIFLSRVILTNERHLCSFFFFAIVSFAKTMSTTKQ